MPEFIPIIVAAVSLIGSLLTFFLTSRDRAAEEALKRATAAHSYAESWASLIEALQAQVKELEEDLSSLEEKFHEEQRARGRLELELRIERDAREKAEVEVRQLTLRVEALETENAYLRAENADLRQRMEDNGN